ncbi:MAG: chromate efflux transporter [Frankia sp.]|nr:chromate efflux transporter [Frankia sp.]
MLDLLRGWGRIGVVGFGGPPTHVAMLRDLCVRRQRWLTDGEFEDALAVCNLLPGPASTQLAIYCAFRLRGQVGALVGGLAFIGPGLVAILALAAVFLTGSPPAWVRGAGAGAGAAVAAVALQAGLGLLRPSWQRAKVVSRVRWPCYLAAGAAAAAVAGPWLVLVLLGCGAVELATHERAAGQRKRRAAGTGGANGRATDGRGRGAGILRRRRPGLSPLPMLGGAATAAVGVGNLAALVWVAVKAGALSYGGGFVIIPLMQADAVDTYHWLSSTEFLNVVALGQVTPGPVLHTVSGVGYAAAGVGGGLIAAVAAFGPSFAFIMLGGPHLDRLRSRPQVRYFLDGAGPAAVGAILGSAVPLALTLTSGWQYAVLAGAAVALLVLRRGVVLTLGTAAVVGAILVGADFVPAP